MGSQYIREIVLELSDDTKIHVSGVRFGSNELSQIKIPVQAHVLG